MTKDEIIAALEADQDLAAAVAANARIAMPWTQWENDPEQAFRKNLFGHYVVEVKKKSVYLRGRPPDRLPIPAIQYHWLIRPTPARNYALIVEGYCTTLEEAKVAAEEALLQENYSVHKLSELLVLRQKVRDLEMVEATQNDLNTSLGIVKCTHCGRTTDGPKVCWRCAADDGRERDL